MQVEPSQSELDGHPTSRIFSQWHHNRSFIELGAEIPVKRVRFAAPFANAVELDK